MNDLTRTRNQISIMTLIFTIIGSLCLILFNKIWGISFFTGGLLSLGYLWHLGFSVQNMNPSNKTVNSFSRLALLIGFMVLIGHILSLNIILIVVGFLCNHLALLIFMGIELFKNKAGTN